MQLVCPHCSNDDPTMMEPAIVVVEPFEIRTLAYYCLVCSKMFEAEPDDEAKTN